MSLLLLGVGGASAAGGGGNFPTIIGSPATFADNQDVSYDITLPADVARAHLVVLFLRMGGSTATVDTPTGWVELSNVDVGPGNGREIVFYRESAGSEGTTVTVTHDAGAFRRLAAISYRIEDHAAVPEVATLAGSTLSVDPPSLTPSAGSSKYLWFASASTRRGDNSFSAAPTGYDGLTEVSFSTQSSTAEARIATAKRELEASSEDPGAFSTTGTLESEHALTVSIEGA